MRRISIRKFKGKTAFGTIKYEVWNGKYWIRTQTKSKAKELAEEYIRARRRKRRKK